MRTDRDGTARAAHCPLCGAQPGAPCINPATGAQFSMLVHRERVRKAAK